MYAYIVLLVAIAIFFGQVWVVEISESIRLSGGNIFYASLMMSIIAFVVLENEISIIPDVIKLLLIVYLFEYLLLHSLQLNMAASGILVQHELSPELFSTPVMVVLSGGFLVAIELLLFLFAFERIKSLSKNFFLSASYFTLAFIVLLCIDGILFPAINYRLFPDLADVVYGGFINKLVLGLFFSLPLMVILLSNKRRFDKYLNSSHQIGDLMNKSREDLALLVAKKNRQIQESEEKYRFIVEEQPVLITQFTPNTELTFVNDAYQKFYGKDSSELIGTKFIDLLMPDEAKRLRKHLNGFSRNLQTQQNEHRALRGDGEIRWLLWSNKALFNDKGEVVSFMSFGTDVTYKKNMEKLMFQSQKMKAVGQLTGGVAHDFNNLLGIISGNLELLKYQYMNHADAMAKIDSALAGTQRGAEIINKLLSFSRPNSSKNVGMNVNDVIKKVLGLIEKSLTHKVQVKCVLAENLWNVFNNPGELQDAILNLVLNARDAMPNGGTLVLKTTNEHIHQSTKHISQEISQGDYVLLSITDDGDGIPKNHLDKIFEPFYTTKEKAHGSGLGLSMVYGFVQRSNGFIKVDSHLDRGTEFRLYLPRADISDTSIETETSTPQLNRSRQSETILLVDDEKLMLEIASEFLDSLGYHTICTSNAFQALEILGSRDDIKLLFSDIIMPGDIDGYDLAAIVTEQWPDVRILLTSGMADLATNKDLVENPALQSAIENIVTKPYTLAELSKAIDTLFEKQ